VTNLFTVASHVAGAWTTASELVPLLLVPAAVWGLHTTIELLDRLAHLTRLVHRAGRATGTLWFRHGLPLLLTAADAISWINSQIEWAEVLATVLHGLRVLTAMTITTALELHHLLIVSSAALGRAYSTLLKASTAAQPRAATHCSATDAGVLRGSNPAPLQHPLQAVAGELKQLSHRELLTLTGTRSKKRSKAQLVDLALALAC